MKQTVTTVVATLKRAAPLNLRKRIGSTTYKVSIRFSETATETLEDKILRLIEREAQNAS
ncbi:MAG: transposon-encoded TnpW family protein [Clostridiales bacterium]|jgi:hypothetical protein|nr:transposon-encoded TnpW family protein [Clostridiales bacterium]